MRAKILLVILLLILVLILLVFLRGCGSPPDRTADTCPGINIYRSAPSAFIPDATGPGPGTPQSVSDTITVPSMGFVNDLNVTLTIQHPQHGDLNIDLVDPTGAQMVRLIATEGGPADGMENVTFDDQAATTPPGFLVNGSCLKNVSFRPAPDSLSAFDGLQIQGDWTLTVSDVSTSDAVDCDCDGFVVGPTCPRTLDDWSIQIDCSGGSLGPS